MKRFLQRVAMVLAGVAALCVLTVPLARPVSAACAAGETALAGKSAGADKLCCPTGSESSAEKCVFAKYINPIIRLLSYIVGIAVVGGMTWGGIQYASSAGDAQKVTKAKASITKALVGLVTFMVFGAFVQFLSPTNLTNPNIQTCNASRKSSFLGLKTWYAYLPASSFDAQCNMVSDLTILPTKTSKGVLPQIVLAIVDDMLRITALVAVAFVITGGVQYITSQGEPARVKQAMSTIINALIGLAIALAATGVVTFIGSQLAK